MWLKNNHGKDIQVEDASFAGGGEATIHRIKGRPKDIAKVYRPDCRGDNREEKINFMMSNPISETSYVAWPKEVLYENGNFIGYIMPEARDSITLEKLVSQDQMAHWDIKAGVARNLAAALQAIHEGGYVIGDFNPANVMVNPKTALVTIIDVDSWQITLESGRILSSPMVRWEYVPAELQGVQHRYYTQQSDLFALAVLLFQTLEHGVHPFHPIATFGGSIGGIKTEKNIEEGACPYFKETQRAWLAKSFRAPSLEYLPSNVSSLFKRAIVDGHKNPHARPAPKEWYIALSYLTSCLKTCSAKGEHVYYADANSCPWCEVIKKEREAVNATPKKPTVGAINAPLWAATAQPIVQPTTQTAAQRISSPFARFLRKPYFGGKVQNCNKFWPAPLFWLATMAGAVAISILLYYVVSLPLQAVLLQGVSPNDALFRGLVGIVPYLSFLGGLAGTACYNSILFREFQNKQAAVHYTLSFLSCLAGGIAATIAYGLLILVVMVSLGILLAIVLIGVLVGLAGGG